MIDFTKCRQLKKSYGGANGNKISVIYNNEIYMLKFPTKAKNNKEMLYSNCCISEYLGSHIFNMLGVKAQETILGKYKFNGKNKLVVACKDFAINDYVFQDFASVKNQIIESSSNGYGVELNDVLEAINMQKLIDSNILLKNFWDTFIIDSLIGNWDRHNGNWGFLYNIKKDTAKLAPIFDLGSSLYPQMDEKTACSILKSKAELQNRVYVYPSSALLINGFKINYYEFITNHINKDCDNALLRIHPRINLNKINNLIDSLDVLGKNHKLALKKLIKARKELILDKAYKDLIK